MHKSDDKMGERNARDDEVARKLHEAGLRIPLTRDRTGFTVNNVGAVQEDTYSHATKSWGVAGEHYVIPTTDELIDACGDRFGSLDRKYNASGETTGWVAKSTDLPDLLYIDSEEDTRRAAVGALYITLQKDGATLYREALDESVKNTPASESAKKHP